MSSSCNDPQKIPPDSFHGPNAPNTSSDFPPSTSLRHLEATQPQSTPTEPSVSHIYTSLHFERYREMRQLGAEMQGKFVGPMPVEEFLDEFLPHAPTPLPWNASSGEAFKLVTEQKTETAMYKPFIEAVQPFCDTLEVIDTHDHPDPTFDKLKPDLCAYAKGCDRRSITDLEKIDIHLEFKISKNDDGFRDWKKGDSHSFENDTEQGKDTKGQVTSYAAAHLASQFRTFIYSVLIIGSGDTTRARLLRWDRSGAVVNETFRLRSTKLAEFFWRHNHLSPEGRGVDVSVSPASSLDAMAAREALALDNAEPVMQIVVAHGDGDGHEARFIIGKPAISLNSYVTGRSTRGFVAYEPTSQKVVYLKDTWRRDVEGIEKEGKTYQALNGHEIPHVVQCVLSGDVRHHATRSQEFVSKPWVCDNRKPKELLRHRHYRLALDVVGGDLCLFASTRELVIAVGDAFEAHKLAYEKARILHRDISVGNILIGKDGRGLLIDWDLSKPRSEKVETARREERIGTWEFMAARLQLAKGNDVIQHTLQDDMESFVHVLGWVALRYIPNNLTPPGLLAVLKDIFDYGYLEEDGHIVGGTYKKTAFRTDWIPALVAPHVSSFHQLLRQLTQACSGRYMKDSETPTEDEILVYTEVMKDADPLVIKALEKSSVKMYLERMECMRNSEWMLGLLRGAVADSEASHWPEGDKAVANALVDLTGDPSAPKRKATSDLVNDCLPTNKRRYSDDSR